MNTETYVIEDLARLQHHLAKNYALYQIGRDIQGEKAWLEDVNPEQPALYGQDYLPQKSPKGFLFAQSEALYEFDGQSFAPIKPVVEARVLFGVQACDLTAIAYQDQFFRDDPYYQARREQTLLVGIDCTGPCGQGFCPLVNAGPQVIEHSADLILSEVSTLKNNQQTSPQWLLLVVSEKGRNSILGMELEPSTGHQAEKRRAMKQQVLSEFADFSYINNSIEYINDNLVPAELWEELSVRCLGCSGCTNLCPTCSCYSTYEQSDEDSNKQTTVRVWDSCQFDSFQREASGHNPNHLAAQRTERFWFHKFSDAYLPEFARYGCVGCGRCEQTCPGTIGVHTVMQRIDQQCCN
jgi:formate hydrogenlyase subunit 6/NADH:ubiquinone oxidoreductase subunit I